MIAKESVVREIPMLPLRGLVVFPSMLLHFDVGREKSVAAVNEAMEHGREIFVVAQSDITAEEPTVNDLYEIGCVAKIRQVLKLTDGNVRILIEGLYRARLVDIKNTDPYYAVTTEECLPKNSRTTVLYREALIRKVRDLFDSYSEVAPRQAPDIILTVMSNDNPDFLSDYIAFNMPVPADDKQYILEQINPIKRLQLVAKLLEREHEILNIDAEISEKVKSQIDENQREYYLKEQLKAISGELYGEEGEQEIENYHEKIAKLNASDEIKEKLHGEVNKLAKMPQGSHEGSVIRGYLDTCLELPFGIYTDIAADIKRSAKILDRDFYGMEKVKERILESLSVYALAPDISGQIICLVGPPGVGKTSIAKTIAECTGRKYARIALGGVHDEAEIRGHRKTYIGAMPGKIINAFKQAGSQNPLILLDEIDKLGNDFRGDPAAALLEVLDGEQNNTFTDHYVDMPFDLSKALFITTANTMETIPAALLDRLEVIELASYTREEKFNIAKEHLVKKQLKAHGLNGAKLRIADDALYSLIDYYTREAGVRKLERRVGEICRKAAKLIVSGEKARVSVTAQNLDALIGHGKYRTDELLDKDEVGVVNGLAWTQVGGELMQLEVSVVQGSGKLELTGSLGEVMQESARAAVTYVRSCADKYGIDPDFYKKCDIHIHAVQAAVPKDGPSAGVTIVTALISALTGRAVKRDVAMTGEISIRGRVLAIGGLKEKTMAAYRAGVKTVYIPKENLRDIDEIDKTVLAALKIKTAEYYDDIVKGALCDAVTQKPEFTAVSGEARKAVAISQ